MWRTMGLRNECVFALLAAVSALEHVRRSESDLSSSSFSNDKSSSADNRKSKFEYLLARLLANRMRSN